MNWDVVGPFLVGVNIGIAITVVLVWLAVRYTTQSKNKGR